MISKIPWIKTEIAKPNSGLAVLVTGTPSISQEPVTLRAIFADSKQVQVVPQCYPESSEYDTESDRHFLKRGWYEVTFYQEQYRRILFSVEAWQPISKPQTDDTQSFNWERVESELSPPLRALGLDGVCITHFLATPIGDFTIYDNQIKQESEPMTPYLVISGGLLQNNPITSVEAGKAMVEEHITSVLRDLYKIV